MDNSPRSITIYQEGDLLFIRVRSCDAIEKVEAIDGHDERRRFHSSASRGLINTSMSTDVRGS